MRDASLLLTGVQGNWVVIKYRTRIWDRLNIPQPFEVLACNCAAIQRLSVLVEFSLSPPSSQRIYGMLTPFAYSFSQTLQHSYPDLVNGNAVQKYKRSFHFWASNNVGRSYWQVMLYSSCHLRVEGHLIRDPQAICNQMQPIPAFNVSHGM